MLYGIAGGIAHAQTPAPGSPRVDARTEVAAALYAASARQAATERITDQKLREQRKQIEDLRTRVHTGEAELQRAMPKAQEAAERKSNHGLGELRVQIDELRTTETKHRSALVEAQEFAVAAL